MINRALALVILCVLIGCGPARATIETETCKVTYTATSGLTAFPYTFKIFEDSDLVVMVRDADGDENTLTLTTDYTVTGAGDDSGGTVTFLTAPYTTYGSGSTVIIQSSIPYTQETDFLEGGRFSADTLEGVLDKNTRLIQQLKADTDRSLKLPLSSTADPNLPDPALNAGRLLRYNASGNGLEAIATLAAGYALDVTAYCDAYDLQVLHNHTYMPIGYLRRSKFTYTGTMTFTVGPGVYDIVGAAGGWRSVFWSSDLTITNTYTDDGWYYLYIDDSAAAVDAPRELEATDFVISATAPSWSNAKQGWYNGNDRCIFAYNVTSGVIRPFSHDGGEYVQHTISSSDRAPADLTAAVGVPVKLPAFSTRGKFTLSAEMDGARLVWIAGGGFLNYTDLGYGISGATVYFPLFDFYVSANQKLTIALADYSGTNNIALKTNGWYFPSGM